MNPSASAPDVPAFAEPPLVSDTLSDYVEDRLAETLDETFPPGSRKPRHDGWGPDQIAGFLRALAATGVVEHAARLVGRSAQSAYNFRNGRQGRAFARMWDAVLINRTRARVASELSGRSIAGCVSVRKRDGVVVGEYHYYDNRLAMALLTRLDRLAEKEAPSEAHLRALSEDLDDFIDCVARGGDADAFVEARGPVAQQPSTAPAREPDDCPDVTLLACLSNCPDYRDADPREIEVLDLDPAAMDEWTSEQWVRAFRSGFMVWLELASGDPDFVRGPGATMRFHFKRIAALHGGGRDEESATTDTEPAIDIADLDPDLIFDWTDDQFARAWNSGFLSRLPQEYWDDLGEAEIRIEDEE